MAEVTRVSMRGLARNAGFAGLASIWRTLSRILLAPIILGYIGIEGYGVWTLLFSIMASVNFVDASFGFAYAVLTAECDGRRAYDELADLLGAGVRIVGGVALVGISTLFVFRVDVLRGLSVPEAMIPEAATAMLLVMSTVALQMSVGCVTQVLNGLQRADLRVKSQMIASTLYFGLGIGLLTQGLGLVALATGYFTGQVVAVVLGWRWARQLCPEFRIALFGWNPQAARRVLGLGARFQMIHFANLASGPGFKMLISALLGPASLAMFELAKKLISLGTTAMTAVISPMMPAFANLEARKKADRVKQLFETGSRLLCALSWVSFGFLWVCADQVIALWTGEVYPEATWTLRLLMIGVGFQMITGMGTARLRAAGAIRLEIIWNVGASVILVIAAYPLYLLYGYEGLVIARVLGLVIAASWFLVAFSMAQGIDLMTFANRALLRPSLVLFPVVALVGWAHAALPLEGLPFGGRWALVVQLGVWGSVMLTACMLAAWVGLVTREERVRITGSLRQQLVRRGASA